MANGKQALACVAIATACTTAGCATPSQPYAYIEPKNSTISTDPNLWPLRVEVINGRSTASTRIQVPPGEHSIRAVSLQQDGFVSPKVKDLTIFVEPCKTYELGARHSSRMNPDWTLEIVKVEDEVACKKKFLDKDSAS